VRAGRLDNAGHSKALQRWILVECHLPASTARQEGHRNPFS
jgi:hypothetical protein